MVTVHAAHGTMALLTSCFSVVSDPQRTSPPHRAQQPDMAIFAALEAHMRCAHTAVLYGYLPLTLKSRALARHTTSRCIGIPGRLSIGWDSAYHDNSSNSVWVSWRSAVSKPSVNQP